MVLRIWGEGTVFFASNDLYDEIMTKETQSKQTRAKIGGMPPNVYASKDVFYIPQFSSFSDYQ